MALRLALPYQEALLERLTLPATDRDELAGVTQLHWRKRCRPPWKSDLRMKMVGTPGEESTVITLAVHPGLAELSRPLREAGHTPQRISLFAQAVRPRGGGRGVLMIWAEQGQTVLDRGGSEAELGAGDLPGGGRCGVPALLLGAEMNGVPVDFARALLASVNAAVTADLQAVLDCPVEPFSPAEISTEGNIDFLPPSWSAEARRSERIEKLKQRLLMAAVVYLLLVACAFLYLAWTKRQLQAVEVQLARLQPLVETTRVRQLRWETLAPALDWRRYTIETLALANKSRPKDDVRINVFDSSPGQFMVEGEAPSAELAIDFAERLRAEPELSDYGIETAPPQILPNDHAHFVITGKRKENL